MYALLSRIPLRLQAGQTKKKLGIHTNKQFQVACHILAQRQTICCKSLFVSSKEIPPQKRL